MKRIFLLSDEKIDTTHFDDVKIVNLESDFKLYYDTSLDIKIIKDNLIIIGTAVSLEETLGDLLFAFENNNSRLDDVIECTKRWSGRWVLIFKNWVIGDPLSSLNLFYGLLDQNKYISNSLGLLKRLGFDLNSKIYNPNSKDEINWSIAPFTRLRNINLLLPFEHIKYPGLEIIENLRFLNKNYETDFSEFERFVVENNLRYADLNLKINLALTAGYDSRFLMATLLKCGIEFSNLTFVDSSIKPADYKISKLISRLFNVRYRIIKSSKIGFMGKRYKRAKLLYDYDLGNCQEIDRKWLINGFYHHTSNRDFLFRGNIGTEVFQGNKNYLIYPKGDGTFVSCIGGLKKKYPKIQNTQIEDLENWWNYRSGFFKKHHLDWRLMFWLDQRCCSWAGAIHSVFDMSNFNAINPLNSDFALGWLYCYTNGGNVENGYQKNLIELLMPKLNDIPYNPKSSNKSLLRKLFLLVNKKILTRN